MVAGASSDLGDRYRHSEAGGTGGDAGTAVTHGSRHGGNKVSVEWSLVEESGGDAAPLAGTWLVRAAGHGEWRTVADRALDDSAWLVSRSPGRWWLDDGLGEADAVLYRRHFDPAVPDGSDTHSDARDWLVASGVCGLGHVWLDGAYLGDVRGRHYQHAFEITGRLGPGDGRGATHLIAIEAAHPPNRPHPAPDTPVADIRIERTGPARIERARVLVIEAHYDRAVLRISATVDSAATYRSEVTTTVLPCATPGTGEAPGTVPTPGGGLARSSPVLARGRNNFEWLVALDQPALWWPAGMGAQPRYDVNIALSVNEQTSHSVQCTTGIRTVSARRSGMLVNGEPHPTGPDSLTIIAHDLAHRGLYETADAAGTLFCQQITLDPSVLGGGQRSLRAVAARAAAAAADRIGNHPSVAAWQPLRNLSGRRSIPGSGPLRDRIMRRALHDADPTRPAWLLGGF